MSPSIDAKGMVRIVYHQWTYADQSSAYRWTGVLDSLGVPLPVRSCNVHTVSNHLAEFPLLPVTGSLYAHTTPDSTPRQTLLHLSLLRLLPNAFAARGAFFIVYKLQLEMIDRNEIWVSSQMGARMALEITGRDEKSASSQIGKGFWEILEIVCDWSHHLTARLYYV